MPFALRRLARLAVLARRRAVAFVAAGDGWG